VNLRDRVHAEARRRNLILDRIYRMNRIREKGTETRRFLATD
jgi:hypothetical protein